MTALDESTVSGILSFLGYGNPRADLWFIGMEEGLGSMDDGEALANLRTRGEFSPVMDLHAAHLRLREGGKLIDLMDATSKTKFPQAWTWMAKIARARDGHSNWSDLTSAKEYVRSTLGRANGGTFLTEFSPIPRRRNFDRIWDSHFPTHSSSVTDLKSRRQHALRQMISECNPALIVCYGTSLRAEFAELLSVRWSSEHEGVTLTSDRRAILLPFLGQGRMRSDILERLVREGLISR